jgi:hypothetical protein
LRYCPSGDCDLQSWLFRGRAPEYIYIKAAQVYLRRFSLSKKSSRNAGLFHSYPVKWDWVMGMLERGIIEIVDTESLVPQNHLLRKIDAAVDWSQLYDMVGPLCCEDNGRPGIGPVVLVKMVLIQHAALRTKLP